MHTAVALMAAPSWGIIAFSPAIVEPLRGFIDLFLSDSLIQTPSLSQQSTMDIARSSAKLVGEHLGGHSQSAKFCCMPSSAATAADPKGSAYSSQKDLNADIIGRVAFNQVEEFLFQTACS